MAITAASDALYIAHIHFEQSIWNIIAIHFVYLHIFLLLEFSECDNINLKMPQQCDTFNSEYGKVRAWNVHQDNSNVTPWWWALYVSTNANSNASVAPSFVVDVANAQSYYIHAFARTWSHSPDYSCPIRKF